MKLDYLDLNYFLKVSILMHIRNLVHLLKDLLYFLLSFWDLAWEFFLSKVKILFKKKSISYIGKSP